MTISLCIALTSQPVRTNSVASQSSSSGMRGRFALRAEVLGGLHQAGAEVVCQNRFTATRAVSGFAGSTSHRARPSRLRRAPRRAAAGTRARPASPCRRACRTRRGPGRASSRGSGISSITITVGMRLDEAFSLLAAGAASSRQRRRIASGAPRREKVRSRACPPAARSRRFAARRGDLSDRVRRRPARPTSSGVERRGVDADVVDRPRNRPPGRCRAPIRNGSFVWNDWFSRRAVIV